MRIACIHGRRHVQQMHWFAAGATRLGHECLLSKKLLKQSTDILATYGNIVPTTQHLNRPWIHLDAGFLCRKRHWRVSANANQPGHYIGKFQFPGDRWQQLNQTIEPWKRTGRTIIVCASSRRNFRLMGLNMIAEVRKTLQTLQSVTDRPIIMRPKSHAQRNDFYRLLQQAHAVVTWSSNSAIEAILAGVPAFVLSNSAAAPVANFDISKIEKPEYPDRQQWAYNLAYHQFTKRELQNGMPWHYFELFGLFNPYDKNTIFASR